MFLLSDNHESGISPLFPIIYKKNEKKVPVNNIESRLKYAFYFIIINTCFSLLTMSYYCDFKIMASDKSFLSLTILFLFYTVVRCRIKTNIIYLDSSDKKFTVKKAPMLSWADHFGFCTNYVVISRVSYDMCNITIIKCFLSFIIVFFSLFCIMPIVNYFYYRKMAE
jgi:hypothetical protein